LNPGRRHHHPLAVELGLDLVVTGLGDVPDRVLGLAAVFRLLDFRYERFCPDASYPEAEVVQDRRGTCEFIIRLRISTFLAVFVCLVTRFPLIASAPWPHSEG
jgi:hypothetical protein